jgi:hypothetical protein
MKLRLKGDSIRLRVGPGDLERLVGTGSVAEQTRFGPGRGWLGYTLEVSAAAPTVSAAFEEGQLRVTVPLAQVHRWAAAPDQASIAADQDASDGVRLSILIEKDFECLHGQDGEDAFPNPGRSGGAAPSTGIPGV